MRNRANVLVGAPDVSASGGITVGDVATTSNIPVDARTPIDEALNHVSGGYISEEGLTKTVDRTTEKIRDWNGDTVLITQSDHAATLQFTFMEAANADVLKIIYGEENVVIAGDNIMVTDNSDELPHFSLNAEMKGSAEKKVRVFAPDAQVTAVGDISFVRTGVIQYQVTVECFDVDGDKLYTFIDGPEAGTP